MSTSLQENSDEAVYFSSSQYFEKLVHDISQAKHNIDFETYIFEGSPIGAQIIDSLVKATKRGVTVRLLVDGIGSTGGMEGLLDKINRSSVEFKIFHPVPWQPWQWRFSRIKGNFFRKMIFFIDKLNERNHRKVCIFDHKIAWIGSANISQNHLPRSQGGAGWRDSFVRIEGDDVEDLSRAFESSWERRLFRKKKPKLATPTRVRLNASRRFRRRLYRNLLFRIRNAKERIWITNAYFIPDFRLQKSLIFAARRGIDVKLLLNSNTDVFFMSWSSTVFYESLLKSGIQIFEYNPSMLHAKSIQIDDWATIGSSNLNYRSLLHDLEVDIALKYPQNVKALERQFEEDLKHSSSVEMKNWGTKKTIRRFLGRLMLLIRYWS